jgi:phosphohistidine swiveling domain-containing protein
VRAAPVLPEYQRGSGALAITNLAKAGGIPVLGCVAFEGDELDAPRAALQTLIKERISQQAPWIELDGKQLAPRALVPSAIIETRTSNGLIQAMQVRVSSISSLARDVAASMLAARQAIVSPFDKDCVESVSIRPALSAWLHAGFEVTTLRLRPGASMAWGTARRGNGRLDFGVSAGDETQDLGLRLARLWPFAFEATIVGKSGRAYLAEANASAESEESNTRLLSESHTPASGACGALANCTPRPGVRLERTAAVVAVGHAQGSRWVSGPLATSLEAAEQMKASGLRPVLVLDHLLPSQCAALRGLGGLALRQDGPASHVTILARTCGLPVLSRLRATDSFWPPDGEVVTLSEGQSAILPGKVGTEVSPASLLANTLWRTGRSRVAIATAGPELMPGVPVGLCRSEMQILGTTETDSFAAYLVRCALSGERSSPPLSVTDVLEDRLVRTLDAANGSLVNYRLIDTDIGELLAGTSLPEFETKGALAGIRGPRWALATEFYRWQIEMAVRVAAQRLSSGGLDLVLTLPSAFDIAEVEAFRDLCSACLTRCPDVAGAVRLGVMIETPRLCAQAHLLPPLADVFSFGLNDLTAAAFGLGRDAWTMIGDHYTAAGMAEHDPFEDLDATAVEPLVEETIRALRRNGAKGPFFLCGAPADGRAAHALAARHEGLFVTVAESHWPSAVLSLAREQARLNGPALSRRWQTDRTGLLARRATAAARSGRSALAARSALVWLSGAAPMNGDDAVRNWKVLKKWLVADLFGELPGRFFAPGWNSAAVAEHARELLAGSTSVRVSAFTSEISCHARSELFDPNWSDNERAAFVDSFDRAATLHVFPQQDPDQLCFRAVFVSGGVLIEAGWGQAMYVFEAERGRHPIVIARSETGSDFQFENAGQDRLTRGLEALLAAKGAWLLGVSRTVSAVIGSDHFAIEGYFDPRTPERVAVVDMDLPLDVAWNSNDQP